MKKITIIGAGIVGLSCAYYLLQRGFEVTMIDPDPEGDKASIGNAAGLATSECVPHSLPGTWLRVPKWLMDPLGPLSLRPSHLPAMTPWLINFLKSGKRSRVLEISHNLAKLNELVFSHSLPVLKDIGELSGVNRQGAIALYASEKAFRGDYWDWELRRMNGVPFEVIQGVNLYDLEPSIKPGMRLGVRLPTWYTVANPRKVLDALRGFLLPSIKIHTASVKRLIAEHDHITGLLLSDDSVLKTQCVLLAAGAWSAELTAGVNERALLESERGYNVTIPYVDSKGYNQRLKHCLLFSEGKFVVTPIDTGIRVGGAAEFVGLNAPANYERAKALLKIARKGMHGIDHSDGDPWMGQRPSTPDSLPVLGPSAKIEGLYYAFGHGHLGLTQSAVSGRLLADVIDGQKTPIDLHPFSITRF